jgi:hypothetical protein
MFPSQDEAVEIARQFLSARGVRSDIPLENVALRQGVDPIILRGEVALALSLSEEADIDAAMDRLGNGRPHWVVAFRTPDLPNTVTTIHSTVVKVFSRNEVSM